MLYLLRGDSNYLLYHQVGDRVELIDELCEDSVHRLLGFGLMRSIKIQESKPKSKAIRVDLKRVTKNVEKEVKEWHWSPTGHSNYSTVSAVVRETNVEVKIGGQTLSDNEFKAFKDMASEYYEDYELERDLDESGETWWLVVKTIAK